MPVEIRELIIRAVVADEGASSSDSPEVRSGGESRPDVQAIVEESVRQILRILRRQEER